MSMMPPPGPPPGGPPPGTPPPGGPTGGPPGGPPPPPALLLLQILTGKWVTLAISTAAQLGVADHLSARPHTAVELAAATGTHPPSLYRLLRALAMVGIFREEAGERFGLTPLGACLRRDAPDSVRGWAVLQGQEYHSLAWTDLAYAVRTGAPAFDQRYGTDFFSWLQTEPSQAAIFDDAMTAVTRGENEAASAYDFGGLDRVVDVGGGRGALLASILQANPGLRGVLFDFPAVVAAAPALLQAAGVADRCEIVGGDFSSGVPAGGDVYLLKHIVHGFDDAAAARILRSCRQGVNDGGRLLLLETVVPPLGVPGLGKLVDLEMLVMTPGGRERTPEEYAALLGAAGWRLTRILPTPGPLGIIEGVPA